MAPVTTLGDRIDPGPVDRLAATIGDPLPHLAPGDPLPPLRHWLFFLDVTPRSELGDDGHRSRGGFLPDGDLPRRLYAGGRITFVRPLTVGARADRVSEIVRNEHKTGRSGALQFVTVRHRIVQDGDVALEEHHDIVYRGAGPPLPMPVPLGPPGVPEGAISRTITPDRVMLFRYSALTFNAHRIHYDQAFCAEEGYPGPVVHGPLLATLACDLAAEIADGPVADFAFRLHAPVIVDQPVTVCATRQSDGRVAVAAIRCDGVTALSARLR